VTTSLNDEYVALLEAVARVAGLNEDGILNCWSPVEEMVDLGGHLAERSCGDCGACHLADAVSELEAWQNEHDYWSVVK
jgi:hypothetical protein